MARMQRNLALIQLPMLSLGATMMMLGSAAAQTPTVRFSNPPTMAKPGGYSHVVEVNGPGRTIYIAGQLGYDSQARRGFPRAGDAGLRKPESCRRERGR